MPDLLSHLLDLLPDSLHFLLVLEHEPIDRNLLLDLEFVPDLLQVTVLVIQAIQLETQHLWRGLKVVGTDGRSRDVFRHLNILRFLILRWRVDMVFLKFIVLDFSSEVLLPSIVEIAEPNGSDELS